MSSNASVNGLTPFALVTPGGAHEVRAVSERLREHGAVLLDGLHGRDGVRAVAELLMDPVLRHRDSGPDGLTALRDLGASIAGRSTFAGLGRGALAPHTDCTQAQDPPRLLLLACQQEGAVGGSSILVDGRRVLGDVLRLGSEVLAALSAPRAAYFGGVDGRFGPVLEPLGDGRWHLRHREDALARFSPDAVPHLPALREAVRRNAVTVRLRPGQALLVDNHRVLHGRSAFTGERLMLRALGAAAGWLELEPGFAAPSSSAA
ncbi:TauD/TfdA family dioxygenase [Kitasatospora phosalacinea]|uniref:TauD/TfdA family dioxygenase n=1 Tax=Kitasatospora phosalacinea TaxID=2065 RepID=UPI0009DDE1AF|nr:TauD/TfdA family dioxygenase [Kitasatospora phosalacinea]